MKFIKHRRGLSNVVTSAILLTSVTVMGSGLVAWSNGNLSAFELSLANTSSSVTNKINENLIIENVAFVQRGWIPFVAGHSVINVTLTNTGSLALNVTQISINSTTIQNYLSSSGMPVTTTLPVTILPKQSYTVSTILPSSPSQILWNSKSLDTITVTTKRGSIFTTQAAAP